MIYKIEIVNNSLVITNTTQNVVVLDEPKQEMYYNIKYLLNGEIVFHNIQRPLKDIVNFRQPISNCIDSLDAPFTENSFISFARSNLGFPIIDAIVNPYPEVNTFDDLPLAASNTGEIYHVVNETGTWILGTRRQNGFYRSNGVDWILRNDIASLLVDNEFNIRDNSDTSKGIKFTLDNLTSGLIRNITWQDKDITVAGLNDIRTVVNMTTNETLPLISTLRPNDKLRYVNRSGNTLTITTSGSDLIEDETSQQIFNGETFDLTIDGNNFRL